MMTTKIILQKKIENKLIYCHLHLLIVKQLKTISICLIIIQIFTQAMFIKYIQNITKAVPRAYMLSTAVAKDSLNYYQILQLDQSATHQNITKSYAELTSPLNPERDSKRFKQLNQAFVILTDNKTRDAYDSLLKVKKTHYLSDQQVAVPTTRSYLSQRKHDKSEQLKKKINIDEFGRYKGGLPQRRGQLRGRSQGQTGALHRLNQVEEALDRFPQFHNIQGEKAESFKNFHSSEREARQIKWPWFTFEVDYHFLTFRKFRTGYWPKIQFIILILYILPTFYYAYERYEKEQLTLNLKSANKRQAEIKQAEHKEQAKSQSD